VAVVGEVREVLEAAQRVLIEDPAVAEGMFAGAAAAAMASGDRELYAAAELGHGRAIAAQESRKQEGLPHFRRAAAAAPGTLFGAEARFRAGLLERTVGATDAALRSFAEAADTFATLDATFDECVARGAGAVLLAELGNEAEALSRLAALVPVARANDLPGVAAELSFAQGRILMRVGPPSDAVAALTIAADLFAQSGAGREEAQARRMLVAALAQDEARTHHHTPDRAGGLQHDPGFGN
jgi:hypothetical protein